MKRRFSSHLPNKHRTFSEKSFAKNYCQVNDIILLADDNQIINEAHKNILNQVIEEKNLNVEIVLCYDGSEILKYLLSKDMKDKIKYIITDENMEYLNGSETIRIIRFLESKNVFPKTKIISLSCYEEKNMVNSFLDAGADYVLAKPLIKSAIIKIF